MQMIDGLRSVMSPGMRIYFEHQFAVLCLAGLVALATAAQDYSLVAGGVAGIFLIGSPYRWNVFSRWLQGAVYRDSAKALHMAAVRIERVRQLGYVNERVRRIVSRSWSPRRGKMTAHHRGLGCLAYSRTNIRSGRRSYPRAQRRSRTGGQSSEAGEGGPNDPADGTVAEYYRRRTNPAILSKRLTGSAGFCFYWPACAQVGPQHLDAPGRPPLAQVRAHVMAGG